MEAEQKSTSFFKYLQIEAKGLLVKVCCGQSPTEYIDTSKLPSEEHLPVGSFFRLMLHCSLANRK